MRGYYLTDEDFKLAEANGISYQNAYNRYYVHGWSKERTITQPLRQARGSSQWQQWKDKAVVNEASFYNRLRKGWSPEEAATIPARAIQYANVKLKKEHLELARQNGLGHRTVKARVYQFGWSVDDAITVPPQIGGGRNKRRKIH